MRVGVFGDIWTACTGFSVVCTNIARQLASHKDLEVYYFGRYGCKEEYEQPKPVHNFIGVNCQGGIWDRELSVRIIKDFGLDLVFIEDDWFSIEGVFEATRFWEKPFFWLSPVDSTPVKTVGLDWMRNATQLFVPSRGAQTYLAGRNVESVYLPHGVNTNRFRPFKVDDKPELFTFVWVGRDSRRKCLGRMLLAFEALLKSGRQAYLLIRTDWKTPQARRTYNYISHKRLPIIMEQMADTPHKELAKTYNRGDCFVCTSKAGGFEMNVIEAQACGLPVLVTDHTFMNEQVVDGKNGFLIKKQNFVRSNYGSVWANVDVNDLAQKMAYYVDRPEMVKIHGRYGMAFVDKFYKWSRAGKTLYDEIKKI